MDGLHVIPDSITPFTRELMTNVTEEQTIDSTIRVLIKILWSGDLTLNKKDQSLWRILFTFVHVSVQLVHTFNMT